MRRLLFVFLLCSGLCFGQGANSVTVNFPGVPTGGCAFVMYAINAATGDFYNCSLGAWSKVNGGGTTINASNNFLPKRSNATTFTDSIISDDGSTATVTGSLATSGTNGGLDGLEGTGAGLTPATSHDLLYPDSTAHRWKMNNNNGGAVQVVASGGDINTSDQVTVTHLAAALPVAQGGTGTASGTSGGIIGYTASGTLASSAALTANILVKGGGAGATPTSGSITDNASLVSTASDAAVSTLSTGGTTKLTYCTGAGASCIGGTEGTKVTSDTTAGTFKWLVDSTAHEAYLTTNASNNFGLMVRAQPGAISSGSKTAAITTATLCAAAAGACNVTGQYEVHWSFIEDGTACATPGTGGVTFLLTWTDANATTHTAVSLGMDDASAINAVSQTFHFQTANSAAFASGQFVFDSNGSVIQYATGYTACGVGTGSYQLRATVIRLQ